MVPPHLLQYVNPACCCDARNNSETPPACATRCSKALSRASRSPWSMNRPCCTQPSWTVPWNRMSLIRKPHPLHFTMSNLLPNRPGVEHPLARHFTVLRQDVRNHERVAPWLLQFQPDERVKELTSELLKVALHDRHVHVVTLHRRKRPDDVSILSVADNVRMRSKPRNNGRVFCPDIRRAPLVSNARLEQRRNPEIPHTREVTLLVFPHHPRHRAPRPICGRPSVLQVFSARVSSLFSARRRSSLWALSPTDRYQHSRATSLSTVCALAIPLPTSRRPYPPKCQA